MIDSLILNAVLDVAWYATSFHLKVGQEYFHTFFTLLIPFAIPAYRTYFQKTSTPPQYHFTPEHWVAYTIAYCVLLLATRDAVEYLTLGQPILDHTLTVCRITLAVFWFSIFRNDDDDDRRSTGSSRGGEWWLPSIWPYDDLSPQDVVSGFLLQMQYGLWLAAQYTKEYIVTVICAVVINTIAQQPQHIYKSLLRTAWRRVPDGWFYLIVGFAIGIPIYQWTQAEAGSLNRWLAHHFLSSTSSSSSSSSSSHSWVTRDQIALFVIVMLVIAGDILFAYIKRNGIPSFSTIALVDLPLVGLTTSAHTIYRRALMIINTLAHSRVPRAVSRLLLLSIVAGAGYLRYTHPSSSSPSSSGLSSSAPLGVSHNPQSNVAEFEHVTSPLPQVVINPSTTSLCFPPPLALDIPTSHVLWCPSTKHNPKYTAAIVTAPATKERFVPIMIVEVYEHEEVMTETIVVGKVCYTEDGDQLPCPCDDGILQFATILDMGAKGLLIVKSVVESAIEVTVDVLFKGVRKFRWMI